jgi:hypothetical protein
MFSLNPQARAALANRLRAGSDTTAIEELIDDGRLTDAVATLTKMLADPSADRVAVYRLLARVTQARGQESET